MVPLLAGRADRGVARRQVRRVGPGVVQLSLPGRGQPVAQEAAALGPESHVRVLVLHLGAPEAEVQKVIALASRK